MATNKDAIVTQVKSLSPDDDERTRISKLISWILRRGAGQANVKQDANTKWVKWSDLCVAEVLKEHSSDYLWQVVVDYNGQKLRYEISDAAGGPWIRSYERAEREAKGEMARKQQQQKDAGPDKGEKGGNEPAAADAQTYNPYNPYNPYMSMDNHYAQLQAAQATAMMMQMQFMSQAYMNTVAQGANSRFTGWVKSVNTEKGFGFISCPQTYAQYQRDVFVRSQDLHGLEQGQMVTFTCEKNKQGMPQARDVTQSSGQPWEAMAQGKGKRQGMDGKGRGKDGKGKDGKGKDGKGKDGTGKGKKGKDGKGEAKRPTLEMPKTVIADLGALAPPRTVIADLGELAPPKEIVADLGVE